MPGLSYSLNIGLNGLQAAQSALSVVGHNIANVNTPGYTRQRPVLATTPPQLFGGLSYGAGLGVTGIESVRNKFLDLQILQGISVKSGLDLRYQTMEGISPAFDPTGEASLDGMIQQFFKGLHDLTARPEDMALRTNVIGRAQQMITGMKERYGLLTSQRVQADQTVVTLVGEVNGLLDQIAQVNARITSESPTSPDNDARDQRKSLTDKLAELIGVSAYEASDGTYTIMLDSGQATLLVGNQPYHLSTVVNPLNNNFNDVLVSLGGAATLNVTGRISGGRMGGSLDLRDNLLARYARQLDQLAAGIQANVNQLHRTGFSLNGAVTGLDFFLGGGGNFAASNLPLGQVAGLPNSVSSLNNYQGMVNALAVNAAIAANPALVAASGLANTAGDNSVALAMANLHTALNTVDTNGDGLGDSGPFGTTVGILVGDLGTQTSTMRSSSTTQENLLAGLQQQRNSTSGVDLDEEATNLLSYQRAYQASARFLSVIDQLTDQLVNQFGR